YIIYLSRNNGELYLSQSFGDWIYFNDVSDIARAIPGVDFVLIKMILTFSANLFPVWVLSNVIM
ncbi:MAG: hypothetical protein Q8807_03530, partial ['Waltheria sp.' little leaf phytoplasma]|nr:hypothetical protein ['Waltheria sp.' little leaf phytoplasma]